MSKLSANELEAMFHWLFVPLYAFALIFHVVAGFKHFKSED